jgi:hypothetical protein
MALGININTITNSIPANLQQSAIDKLSNLLIKKGEEIKSQVQPKLLQEIEKSKDGLLCDDKNKLSALITTRNNIVSKLNNISNFLDQSTLTITGVNTLFELLIISKQTLEAIKLTINSSVKLSPVAAGSIVSTIDDIQTAINTITFNSLGSSRLEKINNTLGGAAISVAVLSVIIKETISLLNQLDINLNKCSNINLTPIADNLIKINEQVTNAESSLNESLYNGFIIEIETVPYTNTVNRYKAIGVNNDGIKLIETPLSFTTNKQTLIDELKFIIDRDNLKAN